MNTSKFTRLNRSLLNFQSFTCTTREINLFKVDIEALHKAALSETVIDFIRLLPMHRRENPTLRVKSIIQSNLRINEDKHKSRKYYIFPVLTQAYGAGKTLFMMNLPKLFETYCPENKRLKESYYIYVDMKKLLPGPEDVINRLYSLILSSFLLKYDAVPDNFPPSMTDINLKILREFITDYTYTGELEQLLRELRIKEEKINLIIKDFKNKKYSLIILALDELKTAESERIYSNNEIKKIKEEIDDHKSKQDTDNYDLDNLVRLSYFYEQLVHLMNIDKFEVISAGEVTSGLVHRNNKISKISACQVNQIFMDSLTLDDISSIIEEVIAKSKMINKEINFSKLAKEIYDLTAGHPLHVGLSIYFYYRSILNNEINFNLEKSLKEYQEVKIQIHLFKEKLEMHKNMKGLGDFIKDVWNHKEMQKKNSQMITRNGDYITNLELLDNLGITYLNGEKTVTPLLPGIYRDDYKAIFSKYFEPELMEKKMEEEDESDSYENMFKTIEGSYIMNILKQMQKNMNTETSGMIKTLEKFKNMLGLRQFLYDVLNKKEIKKDTLHKMTQEGELYTTIELLDNLDITYSDGGKTVIPALPGIFLDEYMEILNKYFEPGLLGKKIFEDKLFAESFLNFSRNLHRNVTDYGNINIKKMFSFLKNFPHINECNTFLDKYIELPVISAQCKNKFDEDCDFTKVQEINPSDHNKLLQRLKEGILYRHGEESLGCDYTYVRTYRDRDRNKKIFFFFQIKNDETKVDLKQEFKKVFIDTELRLEEDCLYRLIIFNSAESNEKKFQTGEAYRVYSWKGDDQFEPILEDYNELEKKVLIYDVSPEEVQKFKESVEVL